MRTRRSCASELTSEASLAWARPNTSATTARTCHPPRPTSRSGNRSREADAGPTSSRHSTPRSQGRRWTRHRTTSATTTTCNSSPMAAPWSRTQTKRTTTSRPRSSQMGSGPSRPRSPTPRPCSRHQWPSTTTTGSTSSQRIPPTTPPARTSCSRPRSRDDGSPRSSPSPQMPTSWTWCGPPMASWPPGPLAPRSPRWSARHRATRPLNGPRCSTSPTPGSPTWRRRTTKSLTRST